MSQIARVNAQLTASATGFTAGFKQAEGVMRGFGKSAIGVAAGLGIFNLASRAATGVYHSTIGLVQKQLEAIDTMKDMAEAAGVTTEALSSLSYAGKFAGQSTEDMASALSKMLVSLGGSEDGTGAAAAAFAKLGLSVDALKAMAPDQAFAAIADKVAGLANPTDKATAANAIFGKSYKGLIPILNLGAAGIAAAQAEAALFNATVSTTDAAAIERANNSMDKMGALMDGIGNAAAAVLSPAIEAVANSFTAWATSGGNVKTTIVDAMESIGVGIAYVSSLVDIGIGVWQALQGTFQAVTAVVLGGISVIAKALVDLVNLIPGVSIEFAGLGDAVTLYADAAEASFKSSGDAFAGAFSGKRATAVRDYFTDLRKAAAAVTPKAGPPTPEIGDINDELKTSAMRYEDAGAAARRYFDATRTDAEKFGAAMAEIAGLEFAGLLDSDTATLARMKALQDMTGPEAVAKATSNGGGAQDPGGPKLLQAGSQEAASFVASIQRRQESNREEKQLVKGQAKQTTVLETIASRVGTSGTQEIIVNF